MKKLMAIALLMAFATAASAGDTYGKAYCELAMCKMVGQGAIRLQAQGCWQTADAPE